MLRHPLVYCCLLSAFGILSPQGCVHKDTTVTKFEGSQGGSVVVYASFPEVTH